MSKSRFHEVRQERLHKSCLPPPTPPVVLNVLPLDVLSFPAIAPPSTRGPNLKRATSFHPGGSQRLRREALVIDGKVTIDTGSKLKSHSLESIASSSSEPNNMDLVVRQLDSGHQSGLERLKNSMLRLMKSQSHWRRLAATGGRERSELSFPTVGWNAIRDQMADGVSHEPLAVRRGQPVPSPLKLVSTRSPLVPPDNPDTSPPFHGSPSVGTLLSELTGLMSASGTDKRESIGVEDMCTNLRYLVSPIIPNSARKESIQPFQTYCLAAGPTEAPDNTVSEKIQAPVEEWNFTSELDGMYGDDPFSYFGSQERMPSFIRPLSITPDIVTENIETQRFSDSSATSVSTFPEPPTETSIPPPALQIVISGNEPAPECSLTQTPSSLSSSIAEDALVPVEGYRAPTCTTLSSTKTSPRSSEDKDEPLAIRRLTLLARSSVAMFEVGGFTSPGKLQSRDKETPKSAAKIVRFAPEIGDGTSLGKDEITCPLSGRQRPRSSSVPPPQRGSLRNQNFFQPDASKYERLSRSQPTTLPSRIPKKRTSTRIDMHGQRPVSRDMLTPAGMEKRSESRRRLSSLIPVAGLKTPHAPFSPDHEKTVGDGKRAVDRNSRLYVFPKQSSRTPVPQSTQPQQKTTLATSWSVTLRQYVKGGDSSGEKRGIYHSQPPRRRGGLDFPPNSPIGTKSLLPVKKTSFFRGGLGMAATLSDANDPTEGQRTDGRGGDSAGNVIGSVDKTGGISYIAPPKVRERSRSNGRVKERQGPSTTVTRTLKPVQIRNFLGRFAA